MADNFKADQARIAKENEEQLARSENVQPVPTQAENDRAKLGVEDLSELDNKESDGGESEQQRAARIFEASAAPAEDGEKPSRSRKG